MSGRLKPPLKVLTRLPPPPRLLHQVAVRGQHDRVHQPKLWLLRQRRLQTGHRREGRSYRQQIADAGAKGKAVVYMSLPLSTLGGGFFEVNTEVAKKPTDRIEERVLALIRSGVEPPAPRSPTSARRLAPAAPTTTTC